VDDTANEERLIAAGRGKWSQPGVPHLGWQCVDIEDLGELLQECEMCETQSIRYVHYMEHPSYPKVLKVGCVCAGNMEGNRAAADGREAEMRSRAGKRTRWLSRRWRVSEKGNHWIRADGYRVTVYKRGAGWAATVSDVNDSFVEHSRTHYATRDLAKLAAFDFIRSWKRAMPSLHIAPAQQSP